MGITESPLSNHLVIHVGLVISCQPKQARLLLDALGLMIATWPLGRQCSIMPDILVRYTTCWSVMHTRLWDKSRHGSMCSSV